MLKYEITHKWCSLKEKLFLTSIGFSSHFRRVFFVADEIICVAVIYSLVNLLLSSNYESIVRLSHEIRSLKKKIYLFCDLSIFQRYVASTKPQQVRFSESKVLQNRQLTFSCSETTMETLEQCVKLCLKLTTMKTERQCH